MEPMPAYLPICVIFSHSELKYAKNMELIEGTLIFFQNKIYSIKNWDYLKKKNSKN